MKSIGLLAALVSLTLGLAIDAHAKGGRSHASSHSSSHTSSHPADNHPSQPGHASDTQAGESGGGFIREAIARPRRADHTSTAGSDEIPAARQVQQAAFVKANIEAETAAQEKRRQLAEQAALASAEQQKRRDSEAASRNRELAAQERQQRQLAWEASCQIEPVMTDLAISTCREVWTQPAP